MPGTDVEIERVLFSVTNVLSTDRKHSFLVPTPKVAVIFKNILVIIFAKSFKTIKRD